MRPRISKAVPGKPPRTHQPPEDARAEQATRDLLREQWSDAGYAEPLEGNLRFSFWFFRSNRQTIDLDNLIKHVLDAAAGIVFVNDCQVTAYGDTEVHLDRDNPRTEIVVEPHESATLLRDYDAATGRVRT